MLMPSSISSQDIANITNSRAAQRQARLLQIEKEQKMEEAEALQLTEEQRSSLLQSFSSVKVEFCDLDGLKWTGSALRRSQAESTSRPESDSTLLLNLIEKYPRRARAQSLFYPTSPSLISSPASSTSYIPSSDTPLPKSGRGSEAFAILNNMDLSSSYDERTVRALVSPVRATFDMQKPTGSARDQESRPPTKQPRHSASRHKHRSRSPVKNLFDSETIKIQSDRLAVLEPTAAAAPAYSDGAPMERQPTSRRPFTRTHCQTELTFGVSPVVATEVMRGRERVRGSRPLPKLPKPAEALDRCTMISEAEEDEIVESDLVGGGNIRFSPPAQRARGPRFQAFGGPWSANSLGIEGDVHEDHFLTPTPERFSEYPISPSTPVPYPRARDLDSDPLKRKRQPSDIDEEQ